MKRNIFGLIGSLLVLFTVFLFGLPYVFPEDDPEASITLMHLLIGANTLGGLTVVSSTIFAPLSFVSVSSFILALIGFAYSLDGIVNKKNNAYKVFYLSLFNILTIAIHILFLDTIQNMAATSFPITYLMVGVGSILLIVILGVGLLLNLIGLIINIIMDMAQPPVEKFSEIYKYKKLQEDGIISSGEFEKIKVKYFGEDLA